MALRHYVSRDIVGFTTALKNKSDYAETWLENEDPEDGRGLVDVAGIVQKCCSTKYISLICTELLRARSFSFTSITKPLDVDLGKQKERLEFVVKEIQRLLRHQTLFPSPNVRARFMALLANDGSQWFDTVCSKLLLEEQWRNYNKVLHEESSCPSYLKDSEGWENYFLNGAPGFPCEEKKTLPKSSLQIIPRLAERVSDKWTAEQNLLISLVRDAGVLIKVRPADSTLLAQINEPGSDDDEEQYTSPELDADENIVNLARNPYNRDLHHLHDQSDTGPTSFQRSADIIHRLNRQLPPNINLGNMQPSDMSLPPVMFPHTVMRHWVFQKDVFGLKYTDEPFQSSRDSST